MTFCDLLFWSDALSSQSGWVMVIYLSSLQGQLVVDIYDRTMLWCIHYVILSTLKVINFIALSMINDLATDSIKHNLNCKPIDVLCKWSFIMILYGQVHKQ